MQKSWRQFCDRYSVRDTRGAAYLGYFFNNFK